MGDKAVGYDKIARAAALEISRVPSEGNERRIADGKRERLQGSAGPGDVLKLAGDAANSRGNSAVRSGVGMVGIVAGRAGIKDALVDRALGRLGDNAVVEDRLSK